MTKPPVPFALDFETTGRLRPGEHHLNAQQLLKTRSDPNASAADRALAKALTFGLSFGGKSNVSSEGLKQALGRMQREGERSAEYSWGPWPEDMPGNWTPSSPTGPSKRVQNYKGSSPVGWPGSLIDEVVEEGPDLRLLSSHLLFGFGDCLFGKTERQRRAVGQALRTKNRKVWAKVDFGDDGLTVLLSVTPF